MLHFRNKFPQAIFVVCIPFEMNNFALFHWFLEKLKQHIARIRHNMYAEHLSQRRFSTHPNRKQKKSTNSLATSSNPVRIVK